MVSNIMLGVQGGRERPQERYIGVGATVGGGGGSSGAAQPRCASGGPLHPRAPVGPRAFFLPPAALPPAARLLHCTAAAARGAPNVCSLHPTDHGHGPV
jgi:hypothetical protein